MGKRRNKQKKRNSSHLKRKTIVARNKKYPVLNKISSVILWLSATGVLAFSGSYIVDYFTGDVRLVFVKPVSHGYEFKLENKSSTDQLVESFNVVPDLKQEAVFKIAGDVYGEFTNDGVYIPGGNKTHVPAYEYKGMNGYVIPAKSAVSFRVPPLVARSYIVPDSMVVFAKYKTRSSSKIISYFEDILSGFWVHAGDKKIRYLVAENYWTPIGDESEANALESACRDDDQFAQSTVCKKYNKN